MVARLDNAAYTEDVGKRLHAVTLAESALRAERELTPAVAGSLYGRLAAGAAYAEDATVSQRAQSRAFELLAVREFDAKHCDLVGASLA